jgi:glutathione S-transferase
LLTLRGDQNEPAYLKLNPNGVVPTLVHDGAPIVESSLILYYIDEAFPEPPLMPKAPMPRLRVRMYNKLIDEYVHNACTILTFATAFRPNFLKVPREVWLAEINKAPLKRRAEYKRSVIEHGFDSEFAGDALAQHRKLLAWMADSLKSGKYLAGESFSNAECAVIPYILRLELLQLDGLWADYPAIAEGAHARARFSQGGDLRSHDREGLGAIQEPRARSLAQGARAAASQLNPDRSNSRWARRRRARTRLKPR